MIDRLFLHRTSNLLNRNSVAVASRRGVSLTKPHDRVRAAASRPAGASSQPADPQQRRRPQTPELRVDQSRPPTLNYKYLQPTPPRPQPPAPAYRPQRPSLDNPSSSSAAADTTTAKQGPVGSASSTSSSGSTGAAAMATTAAAKQQTSAGGAAAAGAGTKKASSTDPLKLFAGAMPKTEIGAIRFLEKYPEYDGRGTVVAIFDTGVDPSAAGLQVTTDGKPKILDIIDCTGSGDIDTATVVTADDSGCIQGASGRQLALNPDWQNPSGQWHVGCRRLFELFPRLLTTRVKEQRKKAFDEAQRKALADASAALQAAATANGNGNGSSKKAETSVTAADSVIVTAQDVAGALPGSGSSSPGKVAAGGSSGGSSKPAPGKAELEARVAYLQEAAKNYDDPGPILDCVVWHDGCTWRVALDTSDMYANYDTTTTTSSSSSSNADSSVSKKDSSKPQGLLADFIPLADFAVERKYGFFSEQDGCAYGVKVYDEGNTLSIVVDAGAHGTHVAGIVAAHFPDDPAANGIAPGAQIISCKIGDSRLGSMETGTGLVRAIAAAMDHKVDLINMSYGEPSARPDVGRVVEVASEAVNKAGIIFVASAGNAGPALGTVGAPGGTTTALLGIGAYVSPELAAAGHSLRDELPAGQQYTWSSRGPAADGDIGVALSAPGGAIAPVPGWTLQRRQLMNGTSMASPCACGGLALVLSGLKATAGEGQWISPARVRRAVEATCTPLGGNSPDAVLTYGRGLLQVDAAFEYLIKSAELDKPDVRFTVSVSGGPGSSAGLGVSRRGVYMRQPHEAAAPANYTVNITPALHEDAPVTDKLAIEEHLVLSATAPWVDVPDLLLLHHNGRSFELRVDPTKLPAGLHYAEVHATLPDQEWRGPLFRVPITVVKPQDLLTAPDIDPTVSAAAAAVVVQAPAGVGPQGADVAAVGSSSGISAGGYGSNVGGSNGDSAGGALPPHTLRLGPVKLTPGQEVRQFVAVPAGATWAEILVRAGSYDTPKVFLLRATQVVPDVRYTDSELRTNVTLSPNSEWNTAFKVVGEASLELTLSQFWSSLGPSSIEVELSFHGLSVSPAVADTSSAAAITNDTLMLDAAAAPLKVIVGCPLRRQRIKPDAKLTQVLTSIRPKDSVLEPLLDPRDSLPGGRVAYRLVLSYSFNVSEGGKYKAAVPTTNGYLYDSPLESQLTQVFDANKRLLYTGDCSPDEVSLVKGDHTARVMLRHDNIALLEKLKNTCLVLSRKLDSPVSVPVYSSHSAAVTGGTAAGENFLSGGDRCVLWLGAPPEDKLPKDAVGRVLSGTLTLGQLRRGAGAAPASTPFSFIPLPAAPKKDEPKPTSSSKPKPAEQRLSEALRDAKLGLLKDLKSDSPEDAALADQLVKDLKAEAPAYLPLLLEIMRRADTAAKGDDRTSKLPDVIAAANDVIAAINTTELAAFLAMRAPADNDSDSGSNGSSGGSTGSNGGSSAADAYKETKAEKDKEKAALLEALKTKLKAQVDLAEASPEDAKLAADVSDTAAALRQWVDTAADKDYLLLHARVEASASRLAAALKAVDNLIAPADEVPASAAAEALKLKQSLLKQLGWGHWLEYERGWARVKFPQKLPPL